jgi:transcriptional regulator with XRE-family HTH domain
MDDVVSLARVVGERVRLLRSENGVPLERVAAEARQLGLGWAKSSVAALEAGRHSLDLGELLLLPTILGRAQVWAYEHRDFIGPRRGVEQIQVGRHPVGLADLIPSDERRVLLAGSTHTSAKALHTLVAGLRGEAIEMQGAKPDTGEATRDEATRLLSPLWLGRIVEAIREHYASMLPPREWHPDHDEEFWPAIGRDAADDATRKAAAVLGVPPIAVALAARARWNGVRGLTAEREYRLIGSLLIAIDPKVRFTDEAQIARDREWNLSGAEKQALGDWHVRDKRETALPPALRRKLQAMRGHFTRDLIRELRPLMKGVTKKQTRRRTR